MRPWMRPTWEVNFTQRPNYNNGQKPKATCVCFFFKWQMRTLWVKNLNGNLEFVMCLGNYSVARLAAISRIFKIQDCARVLLTLTACN